MKRTIKYFVFALLLLGACKNDKYPLVNYVTTVNYLNLRQNPADTSKILYVLAQNEGVYFLDEQSKEKDTFYMNDVKVADYWFKVRTATGVEGWVFAGALKKFEGFDKTTVESNATENFEKLAAYDVNKIFDFYINSAAKYSGTYSYYNTLNGIKILNGDFNFSGSYYDKNKMSNMTVTYTGTYINGDKEAKISEQIVSEDESYSSIVDFYYTNNKISSVEVNIYSSACNLTYEVKNPKFKAFSTAVDLAIKHSDWICGGE